MTAEQWPVFTQGLVVGIAVGVLVLGLHLVLARWRADRRARRIRQGTLAGLSRNGTPHHG